MKNPLLSIIVPVYNVEEYLDKCIESIQKQNFQNYEVIIVDDGSQDNCPAICDKWSLKDDRIIVLHKNNGGLSDARNVGFFKSRGDYVWFVDSDDWIREDALDIVVKGICKYPNVDVFTTYLVEYKDNELSMNFICPNDYKTFKWKEFVDSGDNLYPAQRHIIRRQFLIENNILFIKDILHEDIPFTYMLFYCAKSVVLLPAPIYYYRIREGSIMSTFSFKNCISLFEGYQALLEFMRSHVKTEDEMWYRLLLFRVLKELYYRMSSYFKLEECRNFYYKNRVFLNNQLYQVYRFVPLKEKIRIIICSMSPKIYGVFRYIKQIELFYR